VKRLIAVLLLTTGVTVAGLGAASAKNNDPDGPQYWACVGSVTADTGVCISDPLPPDLPPSPPAPPAPPAPTTPRAPGL
jgi:hypothetical protein